MNSNVTGTGDVVDVRQIRPNTFGKYGRTCLANTAEQVRPYWPNLVGEKKVKFGRNRVRSITSNPVDMHDFAMSEDTTFISSTRFLLARAI